MLFIFLLKKNYKMNLLNLQMYPNPRVEGGGDITRNI